MSSKMDVGYFFLSILPYIFHFVETLKWIPSAAANSLTVILDETRNNRAGLFTEPCGKTIATLILPGITRIGIFVLSSIFCILGEFTSFRVPEGPKESIFLSKPTTSFPPNRIQIPLKWFLSMVTPLEIALKIAMCVHPNKTWHNSFNRYN